MEKLIAYCRVSTDEQGEAKNGLEAQRSAIMKFAADSNYELVEIVEEVASGKLGLQDRPVLATAITKAVKMKATLIVSKLDRLSRDAAFVLNLMTTSAKFIVAELGKEVAPFMLHVYAIVAEQERQLISSRTKSALTELANKGVELGFAKHKDPETIVRARELGAAKNANKADDFAFRMKPSIQRMLDTGMSLRKIAEEFNGNGTKTARGGAWSAATVANIVARWA